MPQLWNYRILISHSWNYDTEYRTIVRWLNEQTYFKWANHSVSADDPFNVKYDYQLKSELTGQINGCTCIIVVCGMYASYSKWIDYEISEAKRLGKPIIAIRPQTQERIPLRISMNATEMVNWNSNSLVDAIRRNT